MDIDKSQNRISNNRFNSDKNTPVKASPDSKNSQTIVQNKNLDLSDLHEAAENFDKGIDKKQQAQIKESIDPKKLNFFEKFLNDNSGMRKFFALGNEIAESCYELAEHLLPKPIAKAFYGVFWSLAVVATGSRVTMNAKMAKPEDRIKAGGKMLLHDGISAIAAPTAVARTANFVQNKLYDPLPLPKTIKHLVKSAVSLLACYFTIHKLDPIAMETSGNIFKLKNDRHKEINDALGTAH